ncbi:hypothetical protein EC9_44120 [Rosistilla ulvae]|uniref:DUF6795 domain-containing protein n=1 Tax=Rosistilla ulvae TaxID=1930277 RepID=A0A517M5Q4_9BACT|nr:DUF4198 domain-containing protein [Rosistilla ulvae]QDS90205.1 hypothetical protein EC9_44120 [Rosistilla ulvae]
MQFISHFKLTWLTGLLLVAGCGDIGTWSDSRQVMLYPVSGIVTLDGQPVEGAQVIFQPAGESQQNLLGTGETDASGRFSLVTVQAGEGAVAGTHNVSVSKRVVTGVNTDADVDLEIFVPSVTEENQLPEIYNAFETSGLTFDVSDQQATEISIALETQTP